MKKRRFDLQLFADETAGTTTETTEETKPETAPAANVEKKDEPKYTDKDVDVILNKKFAEWQRKQQKAVDEAKKLAEMNAEQKANYERDKAIEERDAAIKERDELKKAASLVEMSKTARKMLADVGINIPDELLSMMVTTDAEVTKTNIDSFTKLFNEAKENAVKERLKGEPPRKGSWGAATMTKEQIMAIKDPELRQRKMLENRELFKF